MLEIFRHQNQSFARHVKNILENHKIPCILEPLTDPLSGAVEARVILIKETDEEKSRELLEKVFSEQNSNDLQEWTCPKCSHEIEPQFSECWFCREERA